MKTPRQLLFEHHKPADAKLERLCGKLWPVGEEPADEPDERRQRPFLRTLWIELIWAPRRGWLGLAGLWVVILALNTKTAELPRSSRRSSSPIASEIIANVAERKRLMAQLLGFHEETRAVGAPAGQRPRSQRSSGQRMG